jgi:hypothetical protein
VLPSAETVSAAEKVWGCSWRCQRQRLIDWRREEGKRSERGQLVWYASSLSCKWSSLDSAAIP